jgi:hypothetical protein
VAASSKISSLVVWTEIYSNIKGGSLSYRYENYHLPLYIYAPGERDSKRKAKGSEFLTIAEKYEIYFIFLQYEKWKATMNAYDFMDVVNHVHSQTKGGNLSRA